MNDIALREINEQISVLKEQLVQKKLYGSKLSNLEMDIKRKQDEVIIFRSTLEKEKKDVEKLEKLSFKSIISSIAGNKHIKLDKEQKEYIDAKLKYDSMIAEIEMMKDDYAGYKSKMTSLRNVEYDLDKVIDHKIKLFSKSDMVFKEKYESYSEEVSNLKGQLTEVEQAINIGNRALDKLSEARNLLNKAKSLGSFDMFLSDSYFTSAAKHNAISKANGSLSVAKRYLSEFKKELKDVGSGLTVQSVYLSGVDKTFDIWFDNIFSDWNTQSKVKRSIQSVHNTLVDLRSILRKLDKSQLSIKEDFLNAERKLNSLIKSI